MKPNLVQTQSCIKIYSILTILSLLYCCELWTLIQMDIRRPKTAVSLLDHRRNILKIEVDPVGKKLAPRKQKCLIQVSRMEDIRYSQKNSFTFDLSEGDLYCY
jgi:hypothetical protein